MSRGRWVLPHAVHVNVSFTKAAWVTAKQERQLNVTPVSGREYTIDLEEGSQHLIRYKTIAPLVASGAVQLI